MKRCNDCNNRFEAADGSSTCPNCGSVNTKEDYNSTGPANGDSNPLFDAEQREYLLAASKHRKQLQKSDTESIFDIAARLRVQVADARARDTTRRPKAKGVFDASTHRPGFRFADARRKQNEQEEGEDALNDCELARREHDAYITNAYKQGR